VNNPFLPSAVKRARKFPLLTGFDGAAGEPVPVMQPLPNTSLRSSFIARRIWSGLLCAALTLLGLLPLAIAMPRASDSPLQSKRILILQSTQAGLHLTDTLQKSLLKTLTNNGISRDNIFFEHLDLLRINDVAHRAHLLRLLRKKFATAKPNLIVAVHRPSFDFLANDGVDLFPEIPVLAVTDDHRELPRIGRKSAQISAAVDTRATAGLALNLFPNTTRLLYVVGANDTQLPCAERVRNELGDLPSSVSVACTAEMTHAAMLARVITLPDDSVIIQGPYWRDIDGQRFTPAEVARQLVATAKVPAFGLSDMSIRQGLLGGKVVDTDAIGQEIGELSIAYLQGRLSLDKTGRLFSAASTYMFDWQQIQRWNISPSAVPSDAIFLNRPATIWEYSREILIGLATLLVLLGAVGTLLRQKKRRLVIETATKQHHEELTRKLLDGTAQLRTARNRLAELRFVDDITGLASRHRLDEILFSECRRANRTHLPLSMLMIAIDRFKTFRETHGDEAGNECLRMVSEAVLAVVHRPADLATRFDDDVILLLLPETPHHGAMELAHALREAIAACAFPDDPSAGAPVVTCCMGVLTSSTPPPRNTRELLALVDQQVQRARTEGYDRICALDLTDTASGAVVTADRGDGSEKCAMICRPPPAATIRPQGAGA
jgi:diguanylate cyclase (GGDEF)-like protein